MTTTCGLNRGLAVEIGFGPASGPWPVWRLAGHGMGTAGFRRFRMNADCVSLPDCLFPRTDSEIGRRYRIRSEENTGICGLARELDAEIGFGTRGTLESACACLCGWLVMISEPRYSAVSGWIWVVIVCHWCLRLGLVRRLAVEIGFGSVSWSWPVWRPAGHGLGTAGFSRFRMSANCGRLPNRPFPWTGSEIGLRNRIRYEGNTGISVCPAARPIDDNQRTAGFSRFRLGAVCGRVLWRTAVRTGSGI